MMSITLEFFFHLATSISTPEMTSISTTGHVSSSALSTKVSTVETTTNELCTVMEYIDSLIAVNAVATKPEIVVTKTDFISKGVDFTVRNPSVEIDIPLPGAIVRDLKIFSLNVEEISVVFITNTGYITTPVYGYPTRLSTNQFPSQKVMKVVIDFVKVYGSEPPKGVTISLIACAPIPWALPTSRKC